MKPSAKILVSLSVLVLFACTKSPAQDSDLPQGIAWRKQVARELEFGPINSKKDSTLAKIIVAAIRGGKVHPYSNFNHNFTYQLAGDDITDIIGTKTVTVTSIDPKTGKDEVIKRKIEPEFTKVHKYRILEEWAFNRLTGTTEITILGIAPLFEVFGDDGDFRGIKPLFWVKYNELAGVIADDEKINKGRAMTSQIWGDYFAHAGNTLSPKSGWRGVNTRFLDIDPEKSKTSRLKDLDSDTSLYDHIYYALEKKKLMVYDSTGSNVTLKQLLPVLDTNTFVDPVTNQEVIKVIQHVLIYGNAPKYKLIENWSFDRVAGITRIKIEHIAPTIQKTDDNGNSQYPLEIFRLKFADISGMIEKYEQSHYNRSLANLLWNEYFITPAKPK